MLKSMKMVKVLSQLTEEYPHGCNVGKYLMVESWRKLWLHFKLGIPDYFTSVPLHWHSEMELNYIKSEPVKLFL